MPEIRADQLLLPSVLDRLLDDNPAAGRDPPRGRDQVLKEMKESVRRDLENLLNTRRRLLTWPPAMKELNRSLANYGVPDFTVASLGGPEERAEFCREVQA